MENKYQMLFILIAFAGLHYSSALIRMEMIRMNSTFHKMLEHDIHPKEIERMLMQNKNDSIPLFRYKDTEFYATILIGHPGQIFNVIMDTAWANSWVPSALCSITDIACMLHNKYQSSKSSTYTADGRKIKIDFGNGVYLSGILSNDLVHMGSKNVSYQTFAEMTHIPYSYALNKADGVFGLAFKSISYMGVTPFLDNMISQGVISKKVFSFYFNRDTSSKKGGTLFLGGSEPRHYTGNFTYVDLLAEDYWRFEISSMHIKGNTTDLCNSSCLALIDTSTTTISGPSSAITHLANMIRARPFILGKYMVNCDSVSHLPAITFNIGGRNFVLKSRDYVKKVSFAGFTMCFTVFESNDLPAPFENYWTLGASFMARFYVEFDAENKRIGFADVTM